MTEIKVRMTRELVEELFVRTADGRAISIDFGEPDAEGFHEPVLHTSEDAFYHSLSAEQRALATTRGAAR